MLERKDFLTRLLEMEKRLAKAESSLKRGKVEAKGFKEELI